MFLVLGSVAQPLTYKHTLPDSSLIRALVERLSALSKSHEESRLLHAAIIIGGLKEACVSKQLPPLHWSSLLTPFMRDPGDEGC